MVIRLRITRRRCMNCGRLGFGSKDAALSPLFGSPFRHSGPQTIAQNCPFSLRSERSCGGLTWIANLIKSARYRFRRVASCVRSFLVSTRRSLLLVRLLDIRVLVLIGLSETFKVGNYGSGGTFRCLSGTKLFTSAIARNPHEAFSVQRQG